MTSFPRRRESRPYALDSRTLASVFDLRGSDRGLGKSIGRHSPALLNRGKLSQ
jgi:hypothetical protein